MAKEFDMQDYPGGKLNAFSTTCYGVNTLAGYTGIHDYASVPRRIGQSFPRGTPQKLGMPLQYQARRGTSKEA
jgi:hypothetical protein